MYGQSVQLATTNAVERKNKDCTSDTPQCIKLAMISVYKVDKALLKAHCCKRRCKLVIPFKKR